MESDSPGARARRRPSVTAAERRREIIQVVVRLVDQHGIQGATTARIAAGVGVTEPTLYNYFESRRDMLLAALDSVFDGAEEVVTSSQEPDAIERLRHIGRYHTGRPTRRDSAS
jgi:AcrR family transcriptional regulator